MEKPYIPEKWRGLKLELKDDGPNQEEINKIISIFLV